MQSIDIGIELYRGNYKHLYALSSEGEVTIALIKPNDHPVMSSESLKIPSDRAGYHLFTVIRCTKKRILVSAHHLHSKSNLLFLLDSAKARKISSFEYPSDDLSSICSIGQQFKLQSKSKAIRSRRGHISHTRTTVYIVLMESDDQVAIQSICRMRDCHIGRHGILRDRGHDTCVMLYGKRGSRGFVCEMTVVLN